MRKVKEKRRHKLPVIKWASRGDAVCSTGTKPAVL